MSAHPTVTATTDFQAASPKPRQAQVPDVRLAEVDQTHVHENVNQSPKSVSLSAEIAQTWLGWQCRMIAGVIRGAIYLSDSSELTGQPVSIWPEESEGEALLTEAAALAQQQNSGVVRSLQHYGPKNHRTCDVIATPLHSGKAQTAVVAVMVSTRSESQQQAVLQLLQWGGVWIDTLVNQQSAMQQAEGSFTQSLITETLGHHTSHAAAIEVVNKLADRFGCERVSVGFRQGLPIRLQALSHVASFDPRTQLVRGIEVAMEEAVDQSTMIVQPLTANNESTVTRAHAELLEQDGGAVCTIPLPGRNGFIGAITLERAVSNPFDKDTVDQCNSVAKLIGPVFELKRREERSVWSKSSELVVGLASAVFGSSWLKMKIGLVAMIALLSMLTFIEASYKVTAPATIEGAVRQVLVAPQAGYVKQAEVRAGDMVKKGQLIASLDDRNLQLEHQKWQSERSKVEKEYQESLAKHDRTKLSMLRAQIDQVDAELDLIKQKIEQTQLKAPFAGIVVSGDLSQSLGAPVEIGQVLFEVAPLDNYRVVLEVDEHDVAGMDSGKQGRMIITALPQESFSFSLGQLVPVAVASEGRNYFRTEAALDEPSPMLRPGMRGVAKVEMGERNLLWIWTHAVIDRVRLWFWSTGL